MKLFCALLLTAAAAHPQDDAPDPKALLTDAILHYRAEKDRVARVFVRHGRSEGQAGFGGPVQIMVTLPGSRGKPYEGPAQVWRDADGVTVVTTPAGTLPQFKVYVARDGRAIRQLTFENEDGALNTAMLEHELVSLLDPERFIRHVMAAQGQLQVKLDPATGDATFTGSIDPKIAEAVPQQLPAGLPAAAAQQMRGMFPRNLLLRASAVLVVTKQGRFKSAAIKFTRNDPSKEMLRRWKNKGGGGALIPGFGGKAPPPAPKGGGAPPPPKPGGDEKEKKSKVDNTPIEGGTTTYTLTFDQAEPSDAAKAFKREVARLAAR